LARPSRPFILTGVLSAFLMMGRSGYNAANYSMMEAEARRALESFSEESADGLEHHLEQRDLDHIESRLEHHHV